MDTKDNNKVVLERFLFTISGLIFSVIIMFCYGLISLLVDPMVYHDPDFWTPIALINVLASFGISLLIAYNARVNYRFRNIFKKVTIKGVEVLYLMCLPTLIVVIVTGLMTTARLILAFCCYDLASALSNLMINLFYIAVLILLIETNGLVDYGDFWIVNFTNFAAILFTISYLVGDAVLNMSTDQADIFVDVIKSTIVNFTDCTCYFQYAPPVIHAAKYLESFHTKACVIFGVICSIFLINPLMRHYRHLMNFQITDPPQASQERKPGLSLLQILLSLCCPTLVFVGTIYVLSKPDVDASQYIYEVLTIIIYSMLIGAAILVLRCVKTWQQLVGKQRTFNDILVWISFSGSCFQCFAMIVGSIYGINGDPKGVLNWFFLLKYILFGVQIITQNLLEKVLISKEWKYQSHEGCSLLLPLLLFMGISNGVFAFSNISQVSPAGLWTKDNAFFLRLFIYGYGNLGLTFSTIQRLHGAVLFIFIFFLIKKTCNHEGYFRL